MLLREGVLSSLCPQACLSAPTFQILDVLKCKVVQQTLVEHNSPLSSHPHVTQGLPPIVSEKTGPERLTLTLTPDPARSQTQACVVPKAGCFPLHQPLQNTPRDECSFLL